MSMEFTRKRKLLDDTSSEVTLSSKLSKTQQGDVKVKEEQKQQQHQQKQKNDNKNLRCETPPTTDSENDQEEHTIEEQKGRQEQEKINIKKSNILTSEGAKCNSQHLLEKIQLKILQLQNDLSELNDSENDSDNDNEDNHLNAQLNISAQKAEAIGFAACAQEALLFLQNEGISKENELYKKLHEVLTGQMKRERETDE